MSIDLGSIQIADPVILAPMSGVTDMPFRRLVKRSGAGLVVSEMIASQAMIRHSRQTLQMAQNTPEEFPMAVQLARLLDELCRRRRVFEPEALDRAPAIAVIEVSFASEPEPRPA